MEKFVSEPITVDVNTMHGMAVAAGAPDCPRRFLWRDEWYDVTQVLQVWKHTSSEGRAMGETYVRSHRFRVLTAQGIEAVIYCDRQISRTKKSGWWIYTVREVG